MATSIYSHDLMSWSGPQPIDTDFATVGVNQSLTAAIGSAPGLYKWSPFAYACIYDIIINFTNLNLGTGGTQAQVDIYNTLSAGTSANSYLSSPFTFTSNLASGGTFSARALGLVKTPEIGKVSPANWLTFTQTYVFPLGQVFSVRAMTQNFTGATIANLSAVIQLVGSDLPNLTF